MLKTYICNLMIFKNYICSLMVFKNYIVVLYVYFFSLLINNDFKNKFIKIISLVT